MARASGSYPAGRWFKSDIRYQNLGPLVKRLRHGPFTAVTWVRFPYGSPPTESRTEVLLFLFFCRWLTRTLIKPGDVRRMGSHLPLGDRQACLPGEERANIRHRRNSHTNPYKKSKRFKCPLAFYYLLFHFSYILSHLRGQHIEGGVF